MMLLDMSFHPTLFIAETFFIIFVINKSLFYFLSAKVKKLFLVYARKMNVQQIIYPSDLPLIILVHVFYQLSII